MKYYYVRNDLIVSLERYRDRIIYKIEVDIEEMTLEEYDKVVEELNRVDELKNQLISAGRSYKAPWKTIEEIKKIDIYMNAICPL